MLFNKKLLQKELNNFEFSQDYDFERVNKLVFNWQKAIKDGNYEKTKETRLQAGFLDAFFFGVLGYKRIQDGENEWYLINEAKTEVDETKADGALGFFYKNDENNITRAVIELKDAKTSLDKSQSSRKDYGSPISQAFSYSTKFEYCDWIIVSNFKEIRLYNKNRGQGFYETFFIENFDVSEDLDKSNLFRDEDFKRFYFLLCKDNFIDKTRNSLTDKLIKETSKNEKEIRDGFYKDFKTIRLEIFNHIFQNNPEIDKKILLEKTQKLLDRLVFIMFCEDSSSRLLPENIIKMVYDLGIKSRERSDQRVWREFKNLFQDINEGRYDIDPPINAYNGGLFAYDDILDNFVIKDEIWQRIEHLSSNYDFDSDLNVNVLGHIFEQSLSDLEQLKNEIDGIQTDKNKSKRKKEGVYYTPEYITRYIVEQTVGKYLEENPDKLETIKILDPACGSGAFLNQAHSFLYKQYKAIYEEKLLDSEGSKKIEVKDYYTGKTKIIKGEQRNLKLFTHFNRAEVDRAILLNNLYGADLNEESTEITKLALWLKTAKKTEPLQNLDKNIKCGNSLIDDPEIVGSKAFNWDKEFKDIMNNGGFDVVIGNPPYVNTELIPNNHKEYYSKKYKTFYKRNDLFCLFFEIALSKLTQNGIISYIIPSQILNNLSFKKFRDLILVNGWLKEVCYVGDKIFQDANNDCVILILDKRKVDKIKLVNALNFNNPVITYVEPDYFKKFKNIISFDSNEDSNIIMNKIFKPNNIKISNHFDVFQGIVTGNNPIYIFEQEQLQNLDIEKELLKPVLFGRDFSKWIIEDKTRKILYIDKNIDISNFPKAYKYLLQFKNSLETSESSKEKSTDWYVLHRPREKSKLDTIPKILVQNTRNPRLKTRIVATVDTEGIYGIQGLNFIVPIDFKYSVYFLIAILNSTLINYLFKTKFLNVAIKADYLKDVFFPEPKQTQYKSLTHRAEEMMKLNKNLYESSKQALEFIKEKYNIAKPSQKLEKFYLLGFNLFIEELKKFKVKLSLSEEEELRNWFKDKQANLLELEKQINELDKTIDKEVYELYGLTDEEIKIIEAG